MKLSVCTAFRDEALYLKEWIEFHRLVGVETFYLYNHNSVDNYPEIITPYMDKGIAMLTDWPKENPVQLDIFNDCLKKRAGAEEWIAFIDIDEFLFSPKYETVTEALNAFPEDWGAVGVNWVCFGTGGETDYKDESVIERFRWRVPNTLNFHVKSIVKMNRGLVQTTFHAHSFLTSGRTYLPSGDPIEQGAAGCLIHNSELLRINHYASKSWNEYQTRLLKGDVSQPAGPRKPDDGGVFWLNKTEYDDTIQKFVPRLKEKLKGENKCLHVDSSERQQEPEH